MEENLTHINGEITINVDANVKNAMFVKKDYVWNPSTYNCENGKYLATIMDNSVIMCDEVIESYDEERNFNEKKATCKTRTF